MCGIILWHVENRNIDKVKRGPSLPRVLPFCGFHAKINLRGKGGENMTKQELQEILNTSKNKRKAGKILRKAGYHDVRFYRPTKGMKLQRVAKACEEECNEVDRGKYWLFASIGLVYDCEWIWLEQTRKSPQRYSVSIWVKELY